MYKKYAKVGIVGILSMLFSLNLASAEISRIAKQVHSKYGNFSKEIKNMTIVKKTQILGAQEKITTETKIMRKGEKFRVENTMNMPKSSGMPEMTTITIFDGKDVWVISPMAGKRKIPGKEGEKYKGDEDWWKDISNNSTVVGTETIGNKKCYVIKMEDKENAGFTKIWIDKKNLTLIKFEGTDKKGESIVGINSDFRKIKKGLNILYPYKTEMYINGKLFATSEVTSLTIDKKISDDLFDPNKVKTQGVDMQEMMRKAMEQGGK